MNKNKSFLRSIVGKYMTVLGDRNDKVVIVNADSAGSCRNTEFISKYPQRSFNTGIAEQNMASFAAGLSHEGFIPYIFSMAPFLTMRACEQCRTDIVYGRRNVKMIGVYSGVSGGVTGATHWAVEDCGIMTSIPEMTVFELSDANQAKRLLDLSLEYNGPMYIRVSNEPSADIYSENIDVSPGGSIVVKDGTDGAFLCSGALVQYALEAAEQIKDEIGLSIRVVDMYSIKPIDKDAVIDAANTGKIIAAQDHNIIGGLGSLVSTVIAEAGIGTNFKILGINDRFVAMAHTEYLYHMFEIDTIGLKNNMMKLFDR